MNYLKMLPPFISTILVLVIVVLNLQLDHTRAVAAKCHSELAQANIGIKLQNDTIDSLFKETERQRKLLAQRQNVANRELVDSQKQERTILNTRVSNQCCKALGWGAVEGPKLFP
jgi:hypothetical protein